jgi:hypothetical protein
MKHKKEGGSNRPQNESLIGRVTPGRRTVKLDLRRTRQYLTKIENLEREARFSTDPRVVLTALAVLGR